MKLPMCIAAIMLGISSITTWASESRPNIVFILADDLGWADVAFHGGNAPTPHLDRLRDSGLELTQHYQKGPYSVKWLKGDLASERLGSAGG